MRKGRSTYTFQLNCNPQLVDNLIRSYIQANQFVLEQKNNETYYKAGDAVVKGYRYFNYIINGQNLTIFAWFKGMFGEAQVEQGDLDLNAMSYRNSLNTLFQEINRVNVNGGVSSNNFDPNTGQPLKPNTNNYQMNFDPNTGQPLNSTNQFVQTFQDETVKKQEKMCEIGFWLSLFGFIGSFFGMAFGIIVYILEFYFASQGLKTKKRTKAIFTIIIAIISILIVLYQVAMS